MNRFFKKFTQSIISLSKKKNIDIKFIPNHKGSVSADFQAIERIMNNLVDNAIKYSEKGSEITISTSNESKDYIKAVSYTHLRAHET